MADAIINRVKQRLKHLRRIPRNLERVQSSNENVWTLSRTTNALVGRRGEVQAALAGLLRHGAAVVWGGPGEGKKTVAMEAAAQLRAVEPGPFALALDMRGEHTAVAWGRRSWYEDDLGRPSCRGRCNASVPDHCAR